MPGQYSQLYSDYVGSRVNACLSVTCHLHFLQNDRGLLRSTAVTRELERAPNKSQHRKLSLEKKILPPLLWGFELVTFRSRVQRSTMRYPEISGSENHNTNTRKDAN